MVVYTLKNALYGGLIYTVGDTIAALVSDQFFLARTFGMMLTGATLYAVEIPNYFRWIDRKYREGSLQNALKRAMLAVAYFNPLWVARHIVLIEFFSGRWSLINWEVLPVALESFLYILPVTLTANYLIQNLVPLSKRFMASALFSGMMAVYFSLSEVLYGKG